MRGRRPRGLQLKAEDIPVLEALVHSGRTEQRVARRARILLEMDRRERVKWLSKRVEQDPSTVWRVCRRYEERGMEAVYDAPRSGRPPEISPPQAGPG
jgi:transposase